ncbi:hypothetical protein [Hymenobacter perfusus]|uniref:Uncharacterized protein n=1 Tax=Hymenobacter perfusus TaxID=1236770 RepID=A0A3R9UY98_9BACT|nr:hypothetical protein [Hymenobacter perfusus]RSK42719.1 hypothetical protein EI293_13035 [Hymenobacter perfusus]
MKSLATFLLLAGTAGLLAPDMAIASPDPAKTISAAKKKKGPKLFGKRPTETSYAKAIRRNELFR